MCHHEFGKEESSDLCELFINILNRKLLLLYMLEWRHLQVLSE